MYLQSKLILKDFLKLYEGGYFYIWLGDEDIGRYYCPNHVPKHILSCTVYNFWTYYDFRLDDIVIGIEVL